MKAVAKCRGNSFAKRFCSYCQYTDFKIISDSKKISSHFFHSLSGLRSKFNHIISQILFSNVIEDQLSLEIRIFIQIPPFFHLIRPAKFKSASLNHKFFWISSKWSKNIIGFDLYIFVIKILRAIII